LSSASATTLSVSPMFEVGGGWAFANGMVLRPDLAVDRRVVFYRRACLEQWVLIEADPSEIVGRSY
jgi:hypothetical protein